MKSSSFGETLVELANAVVMPVCITLVLSGMGACFYFSDEYSRRHRLCEAAIQAKDEKAVELVCK